MYNDHNGLPFKERPVKLLIDLHDLSDTDLTNEVLFSDP